MRFQAFSVGSSMRRAPVYPAIATDANPSKRSDQALSAVPAEGPSVLSRTIPGENFDIQFHLSDGIGIST
ncbi:MAG: hypothetical protein AB7I42_16245 [Bradyrhizobium sp.]|uniref:hypothetical protein n=1 Tax=Bradyrhizobium sp. TaxID=376 RepID=UPI003D13B32B